MITPQILERFGCTEARLREVFTARMPDPALIAQEGADPQPGQITQGKADAMELDVKRRKIWEDRIADRLDSGISKSSKSWRIYGAVDLAWDSNVVTKETIPLLLFAQDRINATGLAKELINLKCAEKYIGEDKAGNAVIKDLPAFFDFNINLVRSMVMRRHAAQTVKYNSLWPAYKYEARGTGEVAKLKADVLSMSIDAQTDAYGHRDHENQVGRDVLLYGWAVDLVRSAWERDTSFILDEATGQLRETIDREGIIFVNPHPTRVFYDDAYPLSTINSDTGCTYVGYWDLIRYGELNGNKFWNFKDIEYNSSWLDMWSSTGSLGAAYSNTYFSQMTWTWPNLNNAVSAATSNTRKNDTWAYTAGDYDTMAQIAVYYEKIIPIDHGIGTYTKPIWVRIMSAGISGTVIFAEFLPSRPGAYWGLNQKDDRMLNISFALSILAFQDQLTNLFTQLLAIMKREQLMILQLDTDMLDPEQIAKIEANLKSQNWFASPLLLAYSTSKMMATGLGKEQPIRIVQATSNPQAIEFIFRGISEILRTAERLEAMSPNESGQPIVRGNGGVTATEASQIEATTTAVYGAISDERDTYRGAKKQIFYETWMARSNPDFRTPVLGRYSARVVEMAGMKILENDEVVVADGVKMPMTVGGSKWSISYPYIYTSRDGSERTKQQEVSQILVGMLGVIKDNPSITWGQWNRMINAVIRNSGAGEDLVIETDPEMENQSMGDMSTPQMKQVEAVLMQITQKLEEMAGAVGKQRGDIDKQSELAAEQSKIIADQGASISNLSTKKR